MLATRHVQGRPVHREMFRAAAPAVEVVLPAPEPAREPAPAPEREVASSPQLPAVELEPVGGGRRVPEPVPAGEIVDSGFDREVARAPQLMASNTAVGVFDVSSNTHRTGRERLTAAVTSAGLDGPTREPAPAPSRGVVTSLPGYNAREKSRLVAAE